MDYIDLYAEAKQDEIEREKETVLKTSEATSFMKESISAGYGDHRLDRNDDGMAFN